MARDANSQAVKDDEAVITAEGAKEKVEKPKTGIAALIERIMKTRPVRVFQHFTTSGGDLLSAGMSYQAIFAVFAGITVAFSVAGFIITGNPEFEKAFFDALNASAPGLVGTDGAIDPADLTGAEVGLGALGVVALGGLLLTALGFLASTRSAIRRIFTLPDDTTFFLLQKAKDLGLALSFAIVMLASAVLSVVSTAALDWVFGAIGIDRDSLVAILVGRSIGLVIVLILDTVILAGAFRILSGIHIPFKRLVVGSLIGAVLLGVLKALGSSLLGGATNNPLLASFAVIIGLLIWFNFICRVILLAASWISVGMTDSGIDPRGLTPAELEAEKAREVEEARRKIADANMEKAKEEYRTARGLRRRRLARQIERDAREEARRRESVPPVDQLAEKNKASDAEDQRKEKAETAADAK